MAYRGDMRFRFNETSFISRSVWVIGHTTDVRCVMSVGAVTCQCLTAAASRNVVQADTSWEKAERVEKQTDSARVLTRTSANNCECETVRVCERLLFYHRFVFLLHTYWTIKLITHICCFPSMLNSSSVFFISTFRIHFLFMTWCLHDPFLGFVNLASTILLAPLMHNVFCANT